MTEATETHPGLRPISPLQLRELSLRNNLPALVRVVLQYALILATGTAILMMAARGQYWLMAPLVLLQSYLVCFQFMAVHETAHKTAFRNRLLNQIFGQISGMAIILPYEYYFLFHMDHHRYTQDPERDPELMFRNVPKSRLQLLFAFSGVTQVLKRFWLVLRHAMTGKVTVPWIPEAKRGLIVTEARIYIAIYAALLIGSIAFETMAIVWAWLLPLFLGQLMLRPYLLSEHTGCSSTRNAFENTRTTYTNAAMRWFTWNMPYHTEHHAYPMVPFHALPELNRLVDDRLIHRGLGYRRVAYEVWQILRARALAE